ncbi:MAG: Lrp/AsnC family transcriptional regulator [Ilumatobacteraceae bacterium]
MSTIDSTDEAIVGVLIEDARATLAEIGKRVGLSAPAIKRRIDRLERDGVILGYTARVNHAKLGRPLEAVTELRFSGSARVDVIAGIAADIPEVIEVLTLTGDPDALVRIRVAAVEDLKQVVDQLRGKGDITGTKTMVVLGRSIPPKT